jgi:hypothetical protein
MKELASPGRFGREWTEAICDAVAEAPPPAPE